MSSSNKGRSRFTLATELLCSIAFIIALLTWSALRFPVSLSHGGWVSAGAASAALFTYAAASEWMRRTASVEVSGALTFGAKIGVLIGTFAVINHTAEVFFNFPAPIPAILGVTMWGLMFFAFGAASSATYHKTYSIVPSIIASVWSALVSSVATVLYGCVIGLAFMGRMEVVLSGGLAAGGIDAEAVIRNIFDGAFAHLILAPVVAVVAGAAGVVACSMLRLLARRTIVILAYVDVLILMTGLFAIRFASSLARTARPPFITFGLAALCLSLVSAYPLGTTIRLRKRTHIGCP
jgi:hypothetical protein